MTKSRLRQRLLTRLRRQPEVTRLAKSRIIGQRLKRLQLYRKARRLLCYVAFDGEVETRSILRQALSDGKRVAVPVTDPKRKRILAVEIRDPDRDLVGRGPFGILEPRPASSRRIRPSELDLILVPGIGFDRQGRRLGRGGGYFDRFLGKVPRRIPRVGLAFRFQVVEKLPWEPHDEPVSRVITE